MKLLKFPFPDITIENIYDYYNDDEYDDYEKDVEIIAYIDLVERKLNDDKGKPPLPSKSDEEFLNCDKKIDWQSLSSEVITEVLRRLRVDKNISIEMNPQKGHELYANNPLTISKTIELKFHNKNTDSAGPESNHQNAELLRLLLQTLYNEQKENLTPFYAQLIKQDFREDVNFDLLSKHLNRDTKKSHISTLKKLTDLLSSYLTAEAIGKPTQRAQYHFIYKYFLMLNLLLDENKNLTPFKTVRDIEEAIESKYRQKMKENSKFYVKYFKDAFKKVNKLPMNFDLGGI